MTKTLRIATYNVEWFTELFDDSGNILNDNSASARFGVSKAQQTAAIGAVLQHLDADAIMVIEAPDQSDKRSATLALENFAAHFGLRARHALVGFPSQSAQEIALLYDPDVFTAQHDPMGKAAAAAAAPRFDFPYSYDLNGDGAPENIGFSKPPLEVLLTHATGWQARMIGVHTKSKAAHDTKSRAEFLRLSAQNRRKQLAECFWLRGRVDAVLAQETPLIVLGDFNDGPGLDEYEQQFGYSSVEVVMGAQHPGRPQLFDPHAAASAKIWAGKSPVTSRFYLPEKKGYFEALLDFIMVSPDIARMAPRWRIWHPLHDTAIAANSGLAAALLAASDHFPVSLDVNLPPCAPLP